LVLFSQIKAHKAPNHPILEQTIWENEYCFECEEEGESQEHNLIFACVDGGLSDSDKHLQMDREDIF
jgi:hypothetical protein